MWALINIVEDLSVLLFHCGGSYDPLHLPPYLLDPSLQPTKELLPTEVFKIVMEKENQKFQAPINHFGMQWPRANPPITYVVSGPLPLP